MSAPTLAWILFGLYLVFTTLLALRGLKRTTTFASFALGQGDIGPVTTGITLAAAIASTATFVINPGFVYTHGLSALLHHGVAAYGGVMVGLVVLSSGFRRLGLEGKALTLPHWVELRYRSRPLRTYFALLNLVIAVTFVVLIVKGSALVMQATLGLGYVASLSLIVVFVFSYILLGGTYAHVYTNLFQGALMIGVALLIFASGFHLFSEGIGDFWARLGRIDPSLVGAVNPQSDLFGDTFTVFVSGFVVGIGLVAQPHILTKALYLRSHRDLRAYLIVGVAVCIVYGLVLLAGLYARIEYPDIHPQDAVMPTYLARAFPAWLGAPIAVALLAAGMSTLDGILVSASTIAANDVLLGALASRVGARSGADLGALGLRASRAVLVALGLASFLIALDPPRLVGIFAQWGIYGLVSASFAPIVLGVLVPRFSSLQAAAAAVAGPVVHFGHYGWATLWAEKVINPAVSATYGIAASVAVAMAIGTLARGRG